MIHNVFCFALSIPTYLIWICFKCFSYGLLYIFCNLGGHCYEGCHHFMYVYYATHRHIGYLEFNENLYYRPQNYY